LDHTPSHEITTGNILSEGLKESNNEPVASSLKPRSSEKISGYFGALSSNLVSADASSNDHGDLPSDQKSGITHEEENDRVASLIETSEKEKSTHGLSTSGEKTSRNFSANQEIRELQLSIGSISVTVEGPEGNEGNTEFHRQRSEAMPRQTPSFETEGAEIRRLRRHYLR
jgi:hypothetical protein